MINSFKTKQLIKHIDQSVLGRTKNKVACNLNEVKTIGIVLDAKQEHFVKYAIQYASQQKKEGKTVSVLAYAPKNFTIEGLPCFTKNDINWYCKPVNPIVVDFINQDFDILLNFCPDELLPLESICALSSAKFIIGNSLNHLHSYYDILLKLNNSNAPSSFIENVHHYLTLQSSMA